MKKGLIFDFHRGTTHDGPGMRTTVFFKGCPLHCKWCQNPESIYPDRELQWDERKCIGCLNCIKCCDTGAVYRGTKGIEIDHSRCAKCYTCVSECPSTALNLIGNYWEVQELVREVCKDKMFFADFNGGVTVSGGEPVLQHEFLLAFLKALKAENVNVALDTSGFGKANVYEEIIPFVDVFLYDVKFINEELHRKYTGVGNRLILKNLVNIAEKIREKKDTRLWIRTPLIPGATATCENMEEIGTFIDKKLTDILERWELCAFNNVCREKYVKLQRKWDYRDTELMDEESVQNLADISRKYVGDRLVVSGLTRK